jgi:hypothetical protein
MDEELTCEKCGAKLTGEEGMMICLPCQEEEEGNESSSLLGDCDLKDMLDFFGSRR